MNNIPELNGSLVPIYSKHKIKLMNGKFSSIKANPTSEYSKGLLSLLDVLLGLQPIARRPSNSEKNQGRQVRGIFRSQKKEQKYPVQ
jgi:hypothetical protein